MKKILMIIAAILLCKLSAQATSTIQPFVLPTAVSISSTAIAGAGATVVITTPTAVGVYSTGYYNYIAHLHIEMYATGTLTGGATPVTCTTTNLPGNPVFKFPTAAATGTMYVVDQVFDNALQSTAGGTNTTIVCPATASVIWNVQVNYFQGN
jgi:hypothetical protein